MVQNNGSDSSGSGNNRNSGADNSSTGGNASNGWTNPLAHCTKDADLAVTTMTMDDGSTTHMWTGSVLLVLPLAPMEPYIDGALRSLSISTETMTPMEPQRRRQRQPSQAPPELHYSAGVIMMEGTMPLCYSSGSVRGQLIDECQGVGFWRFDLNIPMDMDRSQVVTYSFNRVSSPKPSSIWMYSTSTASTNDYLFHSEEDKSIPQKWSFHIAAANDATWRWAFTSCNGFSLGVPCEQRKTMGGLQPLWMDMLRHHEEKPIMVQVGGGDQIYCDAVCTWCGEGRRERVSLVRSFSE